ncbi:putative ubiquinol-cytochrome c reductase iron-sulfur subunit (plasmid) [Sinorhizobium fredii NGR234]|uniref:Ubiquinol-cytochrome c reductase iron-sulfur subunit n=1 Tax=Sinorhizobium fredii (strain NBRC 101917 / NGR234) TaxID=394 RepID=C3KQC1_SINFN|nr:putative ubiquinol-cytochrome c reductase iron-sulfur subunit [Sinorhizobium fredii NGR234]
MRGIWKPVENQVTIVCIHLRISGRGRRGRLGEFVPPVNRTQQEIETARATALDDLKDPLARNANLADDQPATDLARSAGEGRENWIVMIGVCTHLGCVPLGQAGDYGGWFCPCHGSHYDTAGRVRKGPAPENLAIPNFAFVSDTVVRIG